MTDSILKMFSGNDVESLTALIEKLEKSSFDYLKLEGGGMKIVIGKNGVCDVSETAAAEAPAPAQPAASQAQKPAAQATVTTAPAAEAAAPEPAPAQPAATEEAEGVFVVKSPSYGIFYAQSEPGAPPYVKLGDTVKKGDTLCLIEIMKTFNALSSVVDGEIVGIHVRNQDTLEPGQSLFSIKVK